MRVTVIMSDLKARGIGLSAAGGKLKWRAPRGAMTGTPPTTRSQIIYLKMAENTRPALPYWPRLMGADLAAKYVGVSRSGFLAQVGKFWPKPKRIGRRVLYDRVELDEAVDELASEGSRSGDPLMEALDDIEA